MKSFTLAITTVLSIYACVCTGQDYVVETYFVVDSQAVQPYIKEVTGSGTPESKRAQAVANMKKDIDYILVEVNKMYDSMRSNGLKIVIKIRELTILATNIFAAGDLQDGNDISAISSLTLFENWLTAQNSYNNLNYDAAVLWTGFDIHSDAGSYTAGYAHVGKVCDQTKATSVVEFNATYITVGVTAHELAHLLGGSHDGIASQDVMAASTLSKHKNRWSFSSCTVTDITDFIALLSPNCLLQNNPASVLPISTLETYSGQMLNHNVICQRSLNNARSFMSLASNLYNNSVAKGDNVCQEIFCGAPGTSSCFATYTPEGMICDKRKRCKHGKCRPDSSPAAEAINANSVMGDQLHVEFSNPTFEGTCTDLIAKKGAIYCYNPEIGVQLCSATCNRLYTNISGCEYGDKSDQCVRHIKQAVCPRQASICCGHCQGFIGKRSIQDSDIPNIIITAGGYENISVVQTE
uniref:Peptidase M12B domain-containing protein n=1 Tax=Arion vulgaris TaxID=1028688 RepID=A0A0B7ACW7_9EUPU